MNTEKRTNSHRAAPPIAQPTPMKSAVRPARRSQVRAFVLKLAWLRFTALLSADAKRSVSRRFLPPPGRAPSHWADVPGPQRDRSDEQRPFGDSAPRQLRIVPTAPVLSVKAG